jgi:hypothetical protein
VQIRIPRQTLATALTSLAEQTGIQLVYRTEEVSATLVAPSVSGMYTPETALVRLLADSGLEAFRINERTLGIRLARNSDNLTAPARAAAQPR